MWPERVFLISPPNSLFRRQAWTPQTKTWKYWRWGTCLWTIPGSTPAWLGTPSESLIILPGSPWSTVHYIFISSFPVWEWDQERDPVLVLTVLSCLAPDAPPSVLPSQTYLEIFIYCLGFFLVMILTATAVLCRLCCAPKKSDFSSQIAVQKLAKSIPLKRQVTSYWSDDAL